MKTTMARRTKVLPSGFCTLLFGSLLWTACQSQPADGRAGRPAREGSARRADPAAVRGFDVEHLAIDVALLPESRAIEGLTRIRLASARPDLAEIALDLQGLTVRSVRDVRAGELAWEHEDELLRVRLDGPLDPGELVELEVRYDGMPRTGLHFSGLRSDGSGPTQVFSQGAPQENSGWFPCVDRPYDRATSEVRVTMPERWVSFAPGVKIDSYVGEGTRTEHWQMDFAHPSYLVSLVAGEFVVKNGEWDGVPLVFAAEPQYESMMDATFEETDEVLAFFSDYTGVRYPYAKYSQVAVANFMWGGMENISATTLTPLTFDDARGRRDAQSHGLVAHEAAHQWFGDLLTCEDWSHVWLNEGFATYMTELYFEATRGRDVFRARMRDLQDEYLKMDRGGKRQAVVSGAYRDPSDLFDEQVYQGGAARLHYLRFLVGDDAFRAGVRTYVAENAGQSVTTATFQEAMEKVTGEDLDWFFEQWFRSAGYPEFTLAWNYDEKRDAIRLDVRQTQASGRGTPSVFRVPVDVEISDASGTSLHRLVVDERRQRFDLPGNGKPFYVRFDKGGYVPKVVQWSKAPAEWLAIANSDDDVNGRRDAVRALGELGREARLPNPEARETYVAELSNLLKSDPSPWVRAEAAEALGRAGGLEARERMKFAARNDPEARVRAASLRGLATFGTEREMIEFADAVFAEGFSYETMVAAAALRCASAPEQAYAYLTQKLFVTSPHDELCRLLLIELGRLDHPAVGDQLLRWSRDSSLSGPARGEALRQLAQQNTNRPRNARVIAEHLASDDFRLRKAAVEALVEMGDNTARKALEAYYEGTASEREKRIIEGSMRPRFP